MRRMILVLTCLPLLAFGSGERRKPARPPQLAGPRIAPSLDFIELDTETKYFAPSPKKPRRYLWEERSNVAKLVEPILNARVVQGGGQALTDLIASLPEPRRSWGISGLTTAQITSGICEAPQIDFDVEHDGEMYEARYRVDPIFFITDPQPALYALTSTCTDALQASAGDLASVIDAGCSPEDEQAHFPPNSRCRACLDTDGDHARCVAAAECKTEMTRALFADGRWHDVLEATQYACAPDFFTEVLVLANDLGEDNLKPKPFEHPPIVNVCRWFYNVARGERRLYCARPDPNFRPAIGDVLVGRVEYIRRPGSTSTPHAGRLYFASGVEVEGVALTAIPLSPETIAPISNPDTNYGFGWNPQLLRPDGADPKDINQTYARDWIATVSVKTATQIDGVPVSFRNRNLCTSDQWQGPDDKGRYYCKEPYFAEGQAPPDDWAWDYTGYYYSFDPPDLEMRPMMTLGNTGLPDPEIPGGHVPRMIGSAQLADPDWDNCAWPHMFEPDEMLSLATEDPVYTHTSQTYRFGKDPENDVRVTLSTSWRRIFCPGPVE